MICIERYDNACADLWNTFVADSRNGTFLFHRGYMDYHADRYSDGSLLARDGDELIALLPADTHGRTLRSHGGLSYGGFVLGERMTADAMLDVFACTIKYLKAEGVEKLIYRPVPHIYHRAAAEEDRYALFQLGARIIDRDVLSVVSNSSLNVRWQSRRRRGARKAFKQGLEVARSEDWAGYWSLLEASLGDRYAARPVHSLSEIRSLAERFPAEIRLFLARSGEDILAGTVIYETPMAARAQYIASNELGRAYGALDLLFQHLLCDVFREKPYFDFGTSRFGQTRDLNPGLIAQKEGFGARTVVIDSYELALT